MSFTYSKCLYFYKFNFYGRYFGGTAQLTGKCFFLEPRCLQIKNKGNHIVIIIVLPKSYVFIRVAQMIMIEACITICMLRFCVESPRHAHTLYSDHIHRYCHIYVSQQNKKVKHNLVCFGHICTEAHTRTLIQWFARTIRVRSRACFEHARYTDSALSNKENNGATYTYIKLTCLHILYARVFISQVVVFVSLFSVSCQSIEFLSVPTFIYTLAPSLTRSHFSCVVSSLFFVVYFCVSRCMRRLLFRCRNNVVNLFQ